MKQISVLRYGHRKKRDKRVTAHCALVSRAFGAKEIIISGEKDLQIKKTLKKVNKKWGNKFKVNYTNSWTKTLKLHKKRGAKIVHLTMYGLPLEKEIKKIRKEKNLLVLIGGEKVPRQAYGLADFNVSVSLQPHSEIAALAVFLDWLFQGKQFKKRFKNAKNKIVPQKNGKKVIKK